MAVNDGSKTVVVVVDGEVVVTTVQVDGPPTPDLALVATLARLRMAARRMGWNIRLEEPCERLRELVQFVGLGDLLLDQAADADPADVLDLRPPPTPGPDPPL